MSLYKVGNGAFRRRGRSVRRRIPQARTDLQLDGDILDTDDEETIPRLQRLRDDWPIWVKGWGLALFSAAFVLLLVTTSHRNLEAYAVIVSLAGGLGFVYPLFATFRRAQFNRVLADDDGELPLALPSDEPQDPASRGAS